MFANLVVPSFALIRTTERQEVLDLHKNIDYVNWLILQLLTLKTLN